MTALLDLHVTESAYGRSLPRARLDELHALLHLGPVADAEPARTLFVASDAGKARLARHLCPTLRDEMMAAPACAIVAFDFPFALNVLASAEPAACADPSLAIRIAARSAALQGEVLMLAARSLGLEAAPIARFDAGGLRAEFFAGTEATVVFLCRLSAADDDPIA